MLSAKIAERESKEGDLFRVMLRDVVDTKHPLVIFANSINLGGYREEYFSIVLFKQW